MQKVFLNARCVNLENGDVILTNILVENQRIKAFGNFENFTGQTIDLEGNYVLPSFVNVFCDSVKAFEQTYEKPAKNKQWLQKLMLVKNILAGAVMFLDASKEPCEVLENVHELEEKQLSSISDKVAKEKSRLFLKVGQTLEELGVVDKHYQKALPYVLEDFGLLDRSPIIVGGNCFEKDDLQLLSQYDCDFCLTVGEDGKQGRRPTNLLALKDFCVGLGSGYSFEIDFFAFMRQILLSHRGIFEDKNCLSEQEVLQIATFNGSKILTGEPYTLKTGEIANFIVVKAGESLYDDIFKTLVWEKSKKDVLMSVIKGEIAQKNGEIVIKNDLNYDIILRNIKNIQGEI